MWLWPIQSQHRALWRHVGAGHGVQVADVEVPGLEHLAVIPIEIDEALHGEGSGRAQLHAAEGVPVLSGGSVTTPFELLCGARSMSPFFFDLIDIPDKIEAVMDAIVPHLAANPCKGALAAGYQSIWVGGWRTAPELLSPQMWRRFVWPYFKRLANEVIDAGLIALLHLDSNWTRELACFRELPRAKCILALDGETDIFKAKEILGDHMCIMGDVPASMLYLDTPDTVYDYCTRLIRELGPAGFILHPGCDIPTNAKLENVQAMVAAALDSVHP